MTIYTESYIMPKVDEILLLSSLNKINFCKIKQFNIKCLQNIKLFSLASERGWYSLYDNKVINGGLKLKQQRFRSLDGEFADNVDTESYKNRWVKTNPTKMKSAWNYWSQRSQLTILNLDHSGYVLELTGKLDMWKKKLKEHLDDNWLDNRTKSLDVDFHIYTPNNDCITMFTVTFQTTMSLLYNMSTKVRIIIIIMQLNEP